MLVLRFRILRQFLEHLVQEVACSAAIGCRYAENFAETEAIELICVEHLFTGVHLVHGHDYRFAAPSEQVGDFRIVIGDARGGLHHEQYQIRFLNSDYYLFSDFFFENVIRTGSISTGIHH